MKNNLTNLHKVVVSSTVQKLLLTILAAMVVAGMIVIELEREKSIERQSQIIAERQAIQNHHAVEVKP